MMKTMNALERVRAEQSRRRTEDGFTLIELLIVMSVMLILMTLAVPQMLKLSKQAQETSAVQSVRTIGQAELQYNSAYPANGFSCSLATLGGDPKSGAPSAQAAQLITPDLASGQKAGYTFAITNCTKVTVNNQDMYHVVRDNGSAELDWARRAIAGSARMRTIRFATIRRVEPTARNRFSNAGESCAAAGGVCCAPLCAAGAG